MKISLCKVAPTGTSFGALLPQGGAGSLEVGIVIGASRYRYTKVGAIYSIFWYKKKQKQRYCYMYQAPSGTKVGASIFSGQKSYRYQSGYQ